MSTPTPAEREQAKAMLGGLLTVGGMDPDEAASLAEFAVTQAAAGNTQA